MLEAIDLSVFLQLKYLEISQLFPFNTLFITGKKELELTVSNFLPTNRKANDSHMRVQGILLHANIVPEVLVQTVRTCILLKNASFFLCYSLFPLLPLTLNKIIKKHRKAVARILLWCYRQSYYFFSALQYIIKTSLVLYSTIVKRRNKGVKYF